MVFSSAIFLFAFLPFVFVLERLLPSIRLKNLWLLLASLIFFAFGQPLYVLLLCASALLNFICGLLVAGNNRRIGLTVALIGNIGILAIFKYTDFVIATLNAAANLAIPLPHILLPIGISFYTFQGLSYVIDVYRDKTLVSRSFGNTLLYIAFFPQLVAGPIVKYHTIQAELIDRTTTDTDTSSGIIRFICGLSKKLLLANTVGQMADTVFSLAPETLGMLAAWTGAVCYTLQIYYDFSGYSDMAIGLGQMFGFHFPENFAHPYAASSIKEFWRRWHISLSTWFRDYLYIPLGGNRKEKKRTLLNKGIVFFVTGLWHGANWTFVLWGLWHGLFSILEELPHFPIHNQERKWIGRGYTMLVVTIGFVLFRASTIGQAGGILLAMFTGKMHSAGNAVVLGGISPLMLVSLAISVILSAPIAKRFAGRCENLKMIGALLLLLLCVMSLASNSFNPFIYFQF